jgi:hypothetical protein
MTARIAPLSLISRFAFRIVPSFFLSELDGIGKVDFGIFLPFPRKREWQ